MGTAMSLLNGPAKRPIAEVDGTRRFTTRDEAPLTSAKRESVGRQQHTLRSAGRECLQSRRDRASCGGATGDPIAAEPCRSQHPAAIAELQSLHGVIVSSQKARSAIEDRLSPSKRRAARAASTSLSGAASAGCFLATRAKEIGDDQLQTVAVEAGGVSTDDEA